MNRRRHGDACVARTLAPWRARVRFFICCVALCLVGAGDLPAASLDVQQALNFGVIAIRDNTAVSTVRVRHRGQPVSSIGGAGGFLMVQPGQPGRYLMRELPPFVPLQITVVASDNLSLGGQGGERLALSDFTFDTLTADANGEAVLLLGATTASSASGLPYPEGPYVGAIDIEVRYWSAVDQAFVTQVFGVAVTAEVRTTIALTQIQALNFGALSAFAHAGQSAQMRLSPTGTVALQNDTSARLTVIGGATPGRIRVSGAAPLQLLQVQFDPVQVDLVHSSGDPLAAHFVVRDFTHTPVGLSFRADANGDLEFSVGATIATPLTSATYRDGTYSGVVTVVVNY